MEKTTVEYMNPESQILMREDIYPCNVPRKGEVIFWHKMYLEVTRVEHHFEQNKIVVLVRQK